MKTPPKNPRNGNEKAGMDNVQAPETKSREGGDDALSSTTANDSKADEKVIVNEEKENKVVNGNSQTAFPGDVDGSSIE